MTTYSDLADKYLYLSASDLRRLMRRHRVTIREFARRTSIALKVIRQRRETGLRGCAVLDWCEAIEGELSPRLRATWNQIRKMADNANDNHATTCGY